MALISIEQPRNEVPDQYVTPDCLNQLYGSKPVLGYATAPLDRDFRVWGPLSAVLYASTTAQDTAWFVKLGEVGPDGKVNLITNGLLKASYRELDIAKSAPGQPFITFQNPKPPEPNRIYEYQIELMPIFHTFKKGHKIWVQIASDDFEHHTRLHTIYTSEMLPVPAINRIYHDAEHASHILLPVIPDAPIIEPVESPLSRINWPIAEEELIEEC